MSYTVQPNPGSARTGAINVGGQVFTIAQTPVGFSVPTISDTSIVNAASSIPGPLIPGEFISIYGADLGPRVSVKGFEKGLGDTRVFVDGVEAYVAYTSTGQVNAMVPFKGTSDRTSNLQVKYQSVPGNTVALATDASFPGIFTVDGSGTGQAVVTNFDGTLNSASSPAPQGSIISFFLTGYGQTNPFSQDGVPPSPPEYPIPLAPMAIRIGGIRIADEDVLFTGVVYVGILQVNVRLPGDLPQNNAVDLNISIGGVSSRSGVKLAVQ